MQLSGQYDNVESTALAEEDRADNSDVPKIRRINQNGENGGGGLPDYFQAPGEQARAAVVKLDVRGRRRGPQGTSATEDPMRRFASMLSELHLRSEAKNNRALYASAHVRIVLNDRLEEEHW